MGKMLFFSTLKTLVNSFISGIVFGLLVMGFVFSNYGIIAYLCLGTGLLISMLYGYDNSLVLLTTVMENKLKDALKAIISFFGNFLGVLVIALFMNLIASGLPGEYNVNLDNIRVDIVLMNHLQVLILSLVSGVLVYFAINTYKKAEQPLARFSILFICSALVTFLGNYIMPFQAYYLVAFNFNLDIFLRFLTSLLGNILGILLIPLLRLLRGRIPSNG